MTSLKEPVCTCEPSAAPKGRSSDCPLHGNPYKLNSSLTANSWVQPYVLRPS